MLRKTLSTTGLFTEPCGRVLLPTAEQIHSTADSKRPPIVLTANLTSRPCPRAHREPSGESIFERRLSATLYQTLIHSVSFMGTSLIEQLLCAAQLSAKNTEVGDPRYHRVLKLTHYLHLHLQDSVCKGKLLDGPDLSSTNILKKLLMRTLLSQKSQDHRIRLDQVGLWS